MARVLLRRLIGPLTYADPADTRVFDEWVASLTPALLEVFLNVQVVTSPSGLESSGRLPLNEPFERTKNTECTAARDY